MMRRLVVRDLAPRSFQTFADLQLWRARLIPGGAGSLLPSKLSTIQEEGETLSRSESSLRSSPYSTGLSPGASFDGGRSPNEASGQVAVSAASDPGSVAVFTTSGLCCGGKKLPRSEDASLSAVTLLKGFHQPGQTLPGVHQTAGRVFADRYQSRGHDGVNRGPLSPVCLHLHRRAHSSRMLLQQLDDKSVSLPSVESFRGSVSRVLSRTAGSDTGTANTNPPCARPFEAVQVPGSEGESSARHGKELCTAATVRPSSDVLLRPALRLSSGPRCGSGSTPGKTTVPVIGKERVYGSFGIGTRCG